MPNFFRTLKEEGSEATLKKSGYNFALEALSSERKDKNIQWAEKIKSADKNSDGRDKT